jgi:predicted N-acetyltransferase YhbS
MDLRIAVSGDVPQIVGLLEKVASEIPLPLDTDERRDAVASSVSQWLALSESLAAIDHGGSIIGFVLVRPDELERFMRDNDALHLAYAAVAHNQRGAGVFAALMQQAKRRQVPITAVVKSANRSGMSARLMRMGFQNHDGGRTDEQHLIWRPGPN